MRIIGAIAAMTQDQVIGSKNAIPWHYSEDFKRFKRVTLNSAVLMGRNTWESMGSKPLPKRRNIVISRQGVSGVECYDAIDAAFAAVGKNEDIWVIGGGQIYQQSLTRCNLLDITTVPDPIDTAGAVSFPAISSKQWFAGPKRPLKTDPRLQCQRFILQVDRHNADALALLENG